MGANAPGFIRWAARGALVEELGHDAEAVLETADRRYATPGLADDRSRRGAAYLAALRGALMEQGFSAERASALVSESVARAMDRVRLPLGVAAWGRHPVNRLARARWRQREEDRLLFSRARIAR